MMTLDEIYTELPKICPIDIECVFTTDGNALLITDMSNTDVDNDNYQIYIGERCDGCFVLTDIGETIGKMTLDGIELSYSNDLCLQYGQTRIKITEKAPKELYTTVIPDSITDIMTSVCAMFSCMIILDIARENIRENGETRLTLPHQISIS